MKKREREKGRKAKRRKYECGKQNKDGRKRERVGEGEVGGEGRGR